MLLSTVREVNPGAYLFRRRICIVHHLNESPCFEIKGTDKELMRTAMSYYVRFMAD